MLEAILCVVSLWLAVVDTSEHWWLWLILSAIFGILHCIRRIWEEK